MDMTAAEKLEAFGLDNILSRLENGQSQREIAQAVGISAGWLNEWLHSDPERSTHALAALDSGADAYEVKAWQLLDDTRTEIRDVPPHVATALVALTREQVQACWRMASARSRRWSASRQGDTFNIDARKQALTSITIQTVRAGGGVRGQVGVGDEKVGVLGSPDGVLPSTATQSKSKRKSKQKQEITDVEPKRIENQPLELPELKVFTKSQMSMIGRGLNLEDYE